MGILDTEFNMLFSIKLLPMLVIPFILGPLLKVFGMKTVFLIVNFLCCFGQMLFALGISTKNYKMCLYGRLLFGTSDIVTVFQQTILCYWFDSKALPFVFGVLLFLVKFVRAANDNFASIFYNSFHSLAAYFWIGFIICVLSFICSVYLTNLHEKVIDK